MASCSSLLSPEDIKEKIRRVLDINKSNAAADYQPHGNKLANKTRMGQLFESPFGTTKTVLVKATKEFIPKTLEYIFCKLHSYSKTDDDHDVLGYYLSIYELIAPGSMSNVHTHLNDFNYEVTYYTVASEEELEGLPKVLSLHQETFNIWRRGDKKPLNPKELLVGVCLYMLLLRKELYYDEYKYCCWLRNQLDNLEGSGGHLANGKGFWRDNKFAQLSTCLMIQQTIDIQPLRVNCFRGIQQIANTESQGRVAFENILQRLEWFKTERLKLIFKYLLEEPFFELLTKHPLNRHLNNLEQAFRFLDQLPSSDVPYVHLVKDDHECQVLNENLSGFERVANTIAHSTRDYLGCYPRPPKTTYQEQVKDKILKMIV